MAIADQRLREARATLNANFQWLYSPLYRMQLAQAVTDALAAIDLLNDEKYAQESE